MPQAAYAALAFAAGIAIPIMASLSGALGRALGSPVSSSLVTVIVGAFAILGFALITGAPMPQLKTLQSAPAPQLLAGLGVAFYLISITYLAPRFGLGNSIMLIVAAQIATSAAIDHFGLLGAVRHPIDAMRALGIVVMIIGVVIAQLAASAAHQRS